MPDVRRVRQIWGWVFVFAVSFVVWVGARSGPRLVPRSVGGTTVYVPDGWQVDQRDSAVLLALEPSGSAYLFVAILRGEEVPTPEDVISIILQSTKEDSISEFRVERRGASSAEAVGGDTRIGVVVQGRCVAALVARESTYRRLGGLALVQSSLRSVPSASGPTPWVGRWTYVGVGSLLNKFDSHGRWIGEASSGSGTTLEFRADGNYVLYYYAQVTAYYVVSEAKVVESGRYRVDGSTVTLKPTSQRGEISMNRLAQPVRDVDLSARTYRIEALRGDALVLVGPCAPFQVDPYCYRDITDERPDPTKVEAVTYRREDPERGR